ncbi:phytase [Wukongibacter sp. M2B1]|uniref:phytase n=1 Tax=Wukongibacter sp. M2B1 TaxID=3088895 RepID=UPI003D7926CE
MKCSKRMISFIMVFYIMIGTMILTHGVEMSAKQKLLSHDNIFKGNELNTNEANNFLVINELKVNIPEDEHVYQYIELRGTPRAKIENMYLLVIDGDEDEEGTIDFVQDLNGQVLGENGLILIKNKDTYIDASTQSTIINNDLIKTYNDDEHKDGIIEHDAITFMLLETKNKLYSGVDLDMDNDGQLELPEDAKIIDSLGWLDGGDGKCYSNVVLEQSASDPDAATRFYNDVTPMNIRAWANGDIYEDPSFEDEELPMELRYDPNEASSNLPPNAKLSPGEHNFINAPFVLINELSIANNNEYIELFSNGFTKLEDVYIVVVEKYTNGRIKYVKDLTGTSFNRSGYLIIQNEEAKLSVPTDTVEIVKSEKDFLPDDGGDILLVYSPHKPLVAGMDIDMDDDMRIDLFGEISQVLDSISYGIKKDNAYGDCILEQKIMGASRYRGYRVVGKASWIYGEVDGLKYLGDNLSPQYARLTPGDVNIADTTAYLVKPLLETARTTEIPPDADDIAYWLHPLDTTKSLVIGTQKEAGYSIYDTRGNTLADVNPGDVRYNNVDVLYDFNLNGEKIDIAVFTDRIKDKFAIYKIIEKAPYLINLTDENAPKLFGGEEGEDTAYGSALYTSPITGKSYGFATQNGTYHVGQFEFIVNGQKVSWRKVRDIILGDGDDDDHAEGMSVDPEYGTIYIGQENVGVYKTSAEANGPTELTEDDMIAKEGDYNLRKDIEGITIYYKGNGAGYILISSQGNSTFSVFDRQTNDFLLSFAVVDSGNSIDGAKDTDSLDVLSTPFGELFKKGILIVQDGQDTSNDPTDIGTNFKWIRWEDIVKETGLDIDTIYNPRKPKNRR